MGGRIAEWSGGGVDFAERRMDMEHVRIGHWVMELIMVRSMSISVSSECLIWYASCLCADPLKGTDAAGDDLCRTGSSADMLCFSLR